MGYYAVPGYALTYRQLRTYLSEHPDVRITYKRGGETVALQRADDRPELVEPVPGWREKVQLFRAVDLQRPGALRARLRGRSLTLGVRGRR